MIVKTYLGNEVASLVGAKRALRPVFGSYQASMDPVGDCG